MVERARLLSKYSDDAHVIDQFRFNEFSEIAAESLGILLDQAASQTPARTTRCFYFPPKQSRNIQSRELTSTGYPPNVSPKL
jgi:hypothetical protein